MSGTGKVSRSHEEADAFAKPIARPLGKIVRAKITVSVFTAGLLFAGPGLSARKRV